MMNIEQEVFGRKKVIFGNLAGFGFEKKKDVWQYSEAFMNGDFRADIFIDGKGNVSGRVFDLAVEEEYTAVHMESRTGAFVGKVREEYEDILQKVAAACFESVYFLYPQSERIAKLIKEKYGELPDFPFSTAPEIGVFRYPVNRKWYGIIMEVERSRVTKKITKSAEDGKIVDVLNIKVGSELMESTLKIKGVYPGYHMQRGNWASIILDGTVADGKIMELIDVSRGFAIKHKDIAKTRKKKV